MTNKNSIVHHISHKNISKALSFAAATLEKFPKIPQAHLDLLGALALLDAKSVSMENATKLLKYFCQTANFTDAFETLAFIGIIPGEHDDSILDIFLKTFGSSTSSSSKSPPIPGGQNIDEFSELVFSSEKELVEKAVDIWDKSIQSIFIPPPLPGRKYPLFQAMTAKSLELILREGKLRFFPEGENVIKQGAVDNSFFILIRGVIEVLREDENSEVKLGFLRPGSFFGEMALVTSAPRNATTRCTEDSYVFEIEWPLLNKVLTTDPELAHELARYTRFRLLKNLMATSVLFRTLPSQAKVDLMASFNPVVIDGNTEIITEGNPSPGLFLVANGEVVVTSGNGDTEVLLSTLRAGDVFGEISLIREGNAKATVKTTGSEAVLLHLDRNDFQNLAITYPELLSHVYQVAIERTRINEQVLQSDSVPADDLLV
ncbi:MAG: cyclic nucleotide-binding domain-containing protein [Deltaproteobacteria bacterium]|nr:cyclic nucleotide-binding domain-containing protein [Deltaproteobacteria bacterium]